MLSLNEWICPKYMILGLGVGDWERKHTAFKITVTSSVWVNFRFQLEKWGDKILTWGTVVEYQCVFLCSDGGIITLGKSVWELCKG